MKFVLSLCVILFGDTSLLLMSEIALYNVKIAIVVGFTVVLLYAVEI